MTMTLETAVTRLTTGYYNALSKTEGNPGGMGANGHATNLPEVAEAIGVVGDELAGSAGGAATSAETATTQAGIATAQADIATTQAGIATTKAGEADASATAAAAAVGGVRVSANDTTPSDLETKLTAGSGVVFETTGDGGDERRVVVATPAGIASDSVDMGGFLLSNGPTEAQWSVNNAATGTIQRGAIDPDVGRYTLTSDVTLDFMGPWYPGSMKAATLRVVQDGTGSRDFTPQLGSRITKGNDLSDTGLDTGHAPGFLSVAQDVASPTVKGWTLTATGGLQVHLLSARRGPVTASPWDYVYAALVKAGVTSKGTVEVAADTYAKGAYANFDLSTGTITGTGASGAGTYLASGIIPLLGEWTDWYVAWVAGDVGSDGGVEVIGRLYLADSSGALTYTPAGTAETLLFGGDVLYAGDTYKGFPLVPATSKDPTWVNDEPSWASQAAATASEVSFIYWPDGTFKASDLTGS